MSGSNAAKLYTSDILSLAVELAKVPYDPDAEFTGAARSQSCGSSLDLSLDLNPDGSIKNTGLRAAACAIGQASAALFARHAEGQDQAAIALSIEQLEGWLTGDAPLPDWPGLEVLLAARSYPARHGAILLPWRAAQQALSNVEAAR